MTSDLLEENQDLRKRNKELIALINAERERQEKCDDVHLRKIADLEKENTELKEELKKWKDEWQEQVQKANDEGYARTLQTIQLNKQTIQLNKAKEIIKTCLGFMQTFGYSTSMDMFVTEAEQFIKEN